MKNTAFAVIAPLLLACGAAAFAGDPSTAYVNATLIDGTGAAARAGRTIVVVGSRISAIGSASDVALPRDARRIDLQGKFVIPGLVNSHVHLATEADPPAAKAYLKRELFSGVTTVRDMAGDVRLLAELKREAEFDEIPSPDIYFAALMAGPEFFSDPRVQSASRGRVPGTVPWARAVTDTTPLPLAVAEARGCGATAIKLYASLSGALVRSITEEAHRQGLMVWAHATVAPARPSDAVDAGVDVVSHAQLLGYESFPASALQYPKLPKLHASAIEGDAAAFAELFASMVRHHTILDATLNTYDADTARDPETLVGDRLAKLAYRAGVSISVGTDDDFDWKLPDSAMFDELKQLADKAGMSLPDLLRSATVVGAQTVGAEATIGTVEAGKLANFVVLARNPLEDVANFRSVILVVKHGIAYSRDSYVPARPQDFQERSGHQAMSGTAKRHDG